MALLIVNSIPFLLNNDNVVNESKNISSVTVEGESPYAAKDSETVTIELSFADTDTFFIHKIALLKASLELAVRTAWKNLPIFHFTSYIGRDEFLEYGYCSSLSFSGQAQDNKKTITIGLTQCDYPSNLLGAGTPSTIANGSIVGGI